MIKAAKGLILLGLFLWKICSGLADMHLQISIYVLEIEPANVERKEESDTTYFMF